MRFNRWLRLAFVALFVCSCGSLAWADDEIIIHGLVSQGYLQSNQNNFLADTESGSFDFNETIINFQKQIDEKLRLGVQLMSRTMGSEDGNGVYVDWGYGDYRVNDRFGVRLGRVKVPFGLYNKYRDIDMLRTTVILPTTLYMEDYRQFISSFDGGAVYGNLPLRKGELEFEFCYGGASADEDSGVAKDWFSMLGGGYEGMKTAALPAAATAAGLSRKHSGVLSRSVDAKNSLSAQLVFNNLIDGLRIGGTRTVFGVDMEEKMFFQPVIDPTTLAVYAAGFNSSMISKARYKSIDVGSIEYTKNRFTFAAELMAAHGKQDTTFTDDIGGAPIFMTSTRTMQGSYAQLVYRHNDKQAWSVYRGECYMDISNKSWNSWQKDTCLSYRYNITPDWSVKVENHWMDGVGLVQLNMNPSGFDRYWNMLAIKTTYNF